MILFAVFIVLLAGYEMVSLIEWKREGRPLLERLALSYLIGAGAVTLLMFALALLKIKFNIWLICLPWLILSPLCFTSKVKLPRLPKLSVGEGLITCALGLKLFYVFYEALIKPVTGWDALWNFSFRAKVFFFERGIPLDRSHPYFLGGGMRQYPPHLPLLEAWTYISQGAWNDAAMKIIFPLYFLALLIVFYYCLRREKSRRQSLFFTFLLSSLPLLTYHAAMEYADFIVGGYFLAAVVYLYQFIKENDSRILMLSAVLAALGPWVKDEGQIFFFICLLVLMVARRFNWKYLLTYLSPYVILIGPWIMFKNVFKLSLGNEPGFSLARFGSYFNFHPEIIPKMLQDVFLKGNWHLLFILWLLVLMFFGRKIFKSEVKYIFWTSALAWLFFTAIYVFTFNWGMVFTGIIVHRNFLTFVPQILLLCGLTL